MSSMLVWPERFRNHHLKQVSASIPMALAISANALVASLLEATASVDMAMDVAADAALVTRREVSASVDIALSVTAAAEIRTVPAPDVWWSMDEASGTRSDSAGGGFNLIEGGGLVGYDSGKVGSAALLATSDVLLHDAAIPNHAADWSWCGWCKPSNTSAKLLTLARTDDFGWLYFRLNGTGWSFRKDAALGGQEELFSNFVPSAQWYFWTLTYSHADKTLRLYVNAALVETKVFDDAIEGTSGSWGYASVGGDPYGEFLADEYARFPMVLGASEISWLYNSGAGRAFTEI